MKFRPRDVDWDGLKKRCTCGSVRKINWFYKQRNKKLCLNSNCVYYYKGFPSKDYRTDFLVYDKDGMLQDYEPELRIINLLLK